MACTVMFVEGKNDYKFFKQAFSAKHFEPNKPALVSLKLEFSSHANAILDMWHLFKVNPRQFFASGDKWVMLVQSNGKNTAKQHFKKVSKTMSMQGIVDMRSLLVIDSDMAPELECREDVLNRLALHLEEAGVTVTRDPADTGKMTSTCTAYKRQKSLRAGVMTVPTNLEEIFAAFLVKRGIVTDRDGPPKTVMNKAINSLDVGDVEGLYSHVFGELGADIKEDRVFARILKELCDFVHG